MYNDLGIGGRLVAYSLSQLEDVRLYKVRLAPQCLLQQLACASMISLQPCFLMVLHSLR